MRSFGSTDRIGFSVNGVPHSVGSEVSAQMMLVDYIREVLKLTGTKYMCRAGGCGVCCVSVRKSPGGPIVPVNSCMIPILSCQDWEITTIEELGNRKKGYHIIQKTLAENNGSQCGYCSPAWVQNMNCLLQNGNEPTMLEIEKAFGGNICRCTGYRPIAEAFKKFAKDAPLGQRITDIEDLRMCSKTGFSCNRNKCDNESDWCVVSNDDVKESSVIEFKLEDDTLWYKVYDIQSIFNILDDKGYGSYTLLHGNTGKGVFAAPETTLTIDISTVQELKGCKFDQNLIIGVGNTINEFEDLCKANATGDFKYLEKFVEHIGLIASIPLKNLGTIGGNLMMKNQHIGFGSDIFLLFATVDAYLEICNSKGVRTKISMEQLLKEDMKGKIIVNVLLPPLNEKYRLETYKIMPRSQNAHAFVNAGFMCKLSDDHEVLEAIIAYGGLSPGYIRAGATEQFLIGKKLFENSTLQSALNILENELVVVESPPSPSVKFRKQLALSLFYKGNLSMCPKDILHEKYRSGATKIREMRPVSSSKQTFDSDSSLWPLNKAIPKVEALIQCAGEAKYTDDLPAQPHEVYAAFVLSTVAVGEIVSIDASKALQLPKVIAFYTADDIPGLNSFIPAGTLFYPENEQILCDGKVAYFNQPIGIIVAETQYMAEKAASLVTATYKNCKVPVTNIKDAVNDTSRLTKTAFIPASDKGTDVVKTIKGYNNIYGQLHVPMELMACVTRPTDEGLEVHVTTQWPDGVQVMTASALGMPANCIDVHVRRLGGAYGLKLSRSTQVAVACSLVTHKLNRACRFVVPFDICANAVGKRGGCHVDYEVAVNGSGVIQYINYNQYEDNGYMLNETLSVLALDAYNNCYTKTKWEYTLYDVVTDIAKSTWCRGTGSMQSIAMAEHVVERIACELALDPFDVRITNVDTTQYPAMKEIAEDLKKSSSYCERRLAVADFNKNNRWIKKGISFVNVNWGPVGYSNYVLNLSVCHSDATVMLTHGGVEMGQGINTKAIQICAHLLNIPVEKIQVKGNNTIAAPNCFMTGGSLASQNIGLGVRRCCEELLEKLKPIRDQMDNPSWSDLILKAYQENINLTSHGYVGSSDVFPMNICGAVVTEVTIDVLTGEFENVRVDILQDVGQSVSPEIDIGQVEGAYIMGQGYWTCENLVYDKNSGELLTDRVFEYFPPLLRDIPQDFRVTFRKNSKSSDQIFGAKCIGEPPICLPVAVPFAIRQAIVAARSDIGIPSNVWFDIDGPMTTEQISLACCVKKEHFKYN